MILPDDPALPQRAERGAADVADRSAVPRWAVLPLLVAELPAALLIGLTVTTVVVLSLGVIIDAPLRVPAVAPALLLLFLGTSAAAARWLSERVSPSLGRIGFVPAGWVLALGLFQLVSRRPYGTEWFLGGDNVRHVGLVSELVTSGVLTYDDHPYPRAWHTLLSLVWLTGGEDLDERSLESFVLVNVSGTWFLFALLVLATSNLAATVAQRLEPYGTRVAPVAAFAAGCWVMTPRFMADTLALGFQTTLLASVVLAVAARECLIDDRQRWRRYAVLVVLVVLVAHTWQLLVPALVVPVAIMGWKLVRSDRQTSVVALASTAVAAVAAWPPFAAAFASLGVGAAASAGVAPRPAWLFFALASISMAWVLRRLPAREMAATGSVVFTPLLVAGALTVASGISLTSYYPSKLVWHASTVGIAFLAPVALAGVVRARRSVAPARIGGVVVAVSASVFALWGLITPLGSQFHAWSTVDAERVMGAVALSDSSNAKGVWMDSPTESAVTRTLLAAARGTVLFDDQPTVAEECEALRAAPTPIVVTSHPVGATKTRYGCVDDLVVLTVRA